VTSVVVLVPVLNRPERVDELSTSLNRSRANVEIDLLFLCTEGDLAEIDAVRMADDDHIVLPGPRQPGDYARKINLGARHAIDDGADWLFIGADDLCFCPGWADEAVRVGERHRKRVVGTNDLGNALVMAGRHATHHLVHATYLDQGTIDEPGKLLHEGYDHQYVDTEMVGTARFRDEWVFAHEAVVEHLHFLWRKANHDDTYALGQQRTREDAQLFQQRMRLWETR
jgi:hypothetical protein